MPKDATTPLPANHATQASLQTTAAKSVLRPSAFYVPQKKATGQDASCTSIPPAAAPTFVLALPFPPPTVIPTTPLAAPTLVPPALPSPPPTVTPTTPPAAPTLVPAALPSPPTVIPIQTLSPPDQTVLLSSPPPIPQLPQGQVLLLLLPLEVLVFLELIGISTKEGESDDPIGIRLAVRRGQEARVRMFANMSMLEQSEMTAKIKQKWVDLLVATMKRSKNKPKGPKRKGEQKEASISSSASCRRSISSSSVASSANTTPPTASSLPSPSSSSTSSSIVSPSSSTTTSTMSSPSPSTNKSSTTKSKSKKSSTTAISRRKKKSNKHRQPLRNISNQSSRRMQATMNTVSSAQPARTKPPKKHTQKK